MYTAAVGDVQISYLNARMFSWRGGRYRVIVTKTGFFVVIKTIPHILWVLLMLDSPIAVKAE
jgi:hypothetical protein